MCGLSINGAILHLLYNAHMTFSRSHSKELKKNATSTQISSRERTSKGKIGTEFIVNCVFLLQVLF